MSNKALLRLILKEERLECAEDVVYALLEAEGQPIGLRQPETVCLIVYLFIRHVCWSAGANVLDSWQWKAALSQVLNTKDPDLEVDRATVVANWVWEQVSVFGTVPAIGAEPNYLERFYKKAILRRTEAVLQPLFKHTEDLFIRDLLALAASERAIDDRPAAVVMAAASVVNGLELNHSEWWALQPWKVLKELVE